MQRYPLRFLFAVTIAYLFLASLNPTDAFAQALQPSTTNQTNQTNYFDTTNSAATDVGDKNMPNLYYVYADPAYTTGAKGQAGFVNDVVQKVVLAVQGVTRSTNSPIYGESAQAYQYTWAFFGLLAGFGLLLSGWHSYHEVISGRATNDIWVWYIARIIVAVLLWTSIINNAPIMLISFINQFTGMASNSLSAQMQNANTGFTDSDAYLQAVAAGKTSGSLFPYLISVAVAYNTLDKTTVAKSIEAISSVVDFQKQLNIDPAQAEKWIGDMYGVSYQIHLDNQGSDALESQYGYNMSEVIGGTNWFSVPRSTLVSNIAAAYNGLTQVDYTPPAQLSPDDQVVAVFLASQRAASLKFYTQVTNRLRLLAGQPMLPVPGARPIQGTGGNDGWLGPNSAKDMPSGVPALQPPNATNPAQSSNNPSNANQNNTLTAAGMLENAIPQPGEAPPVARLVHQPALVRNVTNFAFVEIGLAIWSLPLLLMVTTVFLVLPPQLTGKSYTQHASQAFLHILTLIIGCALIATFVELATLNSASNLGAITDANKKDVATAGANIANMTVGAFFGGYDPVTMIYTGLIIASLPIAVGIVQGTNRLAGAAWGALNASGMSGVTPMAAIESGQTNTLGGPIIKGAASFLTGGISDVMFDSSSAKPRAPTSPSK